MLHKNRRWCLNIVSTPEELAKRLVEESWCCCAAFAVQGHEDYLFLNDATSEDGAAEFGEVKGGIDATKRRQIESITFSWCTIPQALAHIERTIRGEYDTGAFDVPLNVTVETPRTHGTCPLCA
jgi:hypothetical protein